MPDATTTETPSTKPHRFEAEHFLDAFDLPPEQAIEYLTEKGYEITWSWKDMTAEAHQRAFTVAKAMEMDLLTDIRSALEDAQARGIPFEQFKKDLQPKLEARGWWGRKLVDGPDGTGPAQLGSPYRLETIYRTNLASAYMAGRKLEAERVINRRPFWQYIAVLDNRSRPGHAALNGTVLRADDPFWQTSYPPNGYRCRCRVRTLSQKQLDREGEAVVTGDSLDFKPDPAFASAPTKRWEPDLTKYPKDLAAEYRKAQKGAPKGKGAQGS